MLSFGARLFRDIASSRQVVSRHIVGQFETWYSYEHLYRFIFYVAPSIYENEDIKKGILLQLFGGATKDFTSAGRGKFR